VAASPARLITQDARYGQAFLLGITGLVLLGALPFILIGHPSSFFWLWLLGILMLITPAYLWPSWTVYTSPDGLSLKSLLRRDVTYPAQAFVEARAANWFFRQRPYLLFADGRRYPVVFALPLRKSMSYLFADQDKSDALLTQIVLKALAAQNSTPKDPSSA
jgi:hypothetical protein